ncbi:MAG TPA: type II toxin-antitoxin system VapC family toxin [Candidatus Xenobia bacterium]
MILLDTHVWIWYLTEPARLSTLALDTITEARLAGPLGVSSISVWEACQLEARGRLKFKQGLEAWLSATERLSFLHFIPVDNDVARRAMLLPGKLHHDPADRIIVATALQFSASLVTRDSRLLEYPHVRAVW